ncbi:deleted in lung and esophageal cancer protein 1-like [Actinia tenebrosa]|uniref:Deleted in lung and esophageal cancer protein 1-like n=1 Tax=Actinia tenebrosa TaxID=6105 RepID=A0A6P8IGK0_ACTTE|nr:deleted in lung and esophageal cancer protein 1-like [Actinia tenebrosa]
MSGSKGIEMEPPMHLQRPSSARSQDISHVLASVFREVFTRDVVGEQTVKHLTTSRSGEEGYHDKYVRQLEEIQEKREKCHREADMLEAHIMQAQASAMAADERDLQKALGQCEQYPNLGLPPGQSNLRYCLDTQLLRKFNLIVPEDFTSNGQTEAKPPQADEIPSYARFTTSSHQRYRKTPPLTDYLDDRVTSSLGYPFTVASKPATAERKTREISTPATTHTKISKAIWKNSMKPSQRQIEREDLKKLKSKAEYKRNPRFVPPLTADLIQEKSKAKEVKESATGSSQVVFIATPSPVVFSEYKVGEVYELMVELKNVTSSSRQIRIVPPSTKYFSIGLGRFPGESGVVAPGMSCVYPIRFSPDFLADYDDTIKVKTQIDPPMVISLQGRRPPPQLSLSSVLDCGHTLVGGKKTVHFTCTNQGGEGQFFLMSKSDWPTTYSKWSLDNPGFLDIAPFEVKPAMFELKSGETIDLEVTFCPSAAKFFKKEMIMVCDNCHIKVLTVEGTGQTAGIEFVSISGGTSKHDIGELKDVSSQFLVRFDDQNPKTHTAKELTIKNTTNVALPFRWKLFKPFFPCQQTDELGVSTSQQLSSRVHRTADAQGVFSIAPNMGTLPPYENVHFSLEYLPKEIGSFHSVAHLVLEEIPVHGQENATSVSRDVTAIEVEVKANSQPFHVQVNPGTLTIPGTLLMATSNTYKFKAHNHSVSDVQVEWQDMSTDECTINIQPQSTVIAANQPREFSVSITSHVPGVLDQTLFCHVDYSSSPVYLHVRASFEGPEVTMDTLDLDFGLVRLGESASREISVTNKSNITAEWSMQECVDCISDGKDQKCNNSSSSLTSEFDFVPTTGSLGAGESAVVSVTFRPTHCRRVRTVFQCQEKIGKTNYLSVFSEVQSPLVCLLSSSLYLENVYLDVPVSRTITLQNQTLLTSEFCWNEIICNKDSDYSVTFEPSRGVLQPREALDVRVTLTGHRKGLVESLTTSCHVTGMDKPIWLGISADVKGLNVTFEMPKILDHHTPDEIKTANIDSSSTNMIEFGKMFLGEERKATVVMTNTTAIRARFSVHVNHFTAAKPPTPPEGQPQKRDGRRPQGLLTRTPNIANPLSKTATKAYADQVSACLRDGRGAAFVPSPSSGELLPFGYQVIEITAYNDMWGDYRDLLICMVEGLDPVYIPIQMSVLGCPLNFQMMKDQSPVLRFGTHVSGATPVTRSLRVNNTSPFDIRLDWSTLNIEDDDDQLLDMLVSYGQALPVFNDKGEELLPPPPLCDFPCFMPPFIQVKLLEHEGIRSDEPFQVLPSQQVIPAKGHANMTVTFKPNTTNPAGQTCTSFAAGYMSLDGPNIDIPGRVTRSQGMDMTPFRLDITATILPALLSVEMEEDEGCDFIATASNLLNGDFTKIHRFILSNTSETPLALNIAVDAPFKVMSSEPPPSAKSTRSQANGLTIIKPGKNIQVKIGFCLTKELLSRVDELPVNKEQEDGSLLTVKENGDRKLFFNRKLVVEFSNKSTQVIPLTASVSVPTLRLSKQELDFGTCLVGQEKEMQVVLTNPTESSSEWVAVKDPRCPQVSRDVFTVTPSNGLLEAYVNHVAKNKVLIRVTFVARHNVEYECVLIFKGRLHEEEQHVVLKGRGSYDGRHENLVNVVTQF